MILFFHFICLLARYIIVNISKSISLRKIFSDSDSINSQSSDYMQAHNKKNIKLPVYEDGNLKFFPPVYVQRYETVALILQDFAFKKNIQKVVDFGCADLGLFMYLKNIDSVNEVLEVDIDVEVLKRNAFKGAPLTVDYLMTKSKKPLDVYVLAGSIAEYDDYLQGIDAVVAIELIEHLSEEAFEKMPHNVFHQIRPKIAIFTTPNADFNCLFPKLTEFRHKDHKFEWTRREFYNWTQEILYKYPEYSCKFYGIGAGPEGTENLGCCTQMVVFHRSEELESTIGGRENLGVHNYQLIKHYKYPVFEDMRTTEEKVLHEILFQVSHINSLPAYYNYEDNESEIPLNLLWDYVSDFCQDEKEFREILQKNGMRLKYQNNNWYLLYSESEENSSENSFADEDWSNEELLASSDYKHDPSFDNWDLNEEPLCSENDKTFEITKHESVSNNYTEKQADEFCVLNDGISSSLECCMSNSKHNENVKTISCNSKNKEIKKSDISKSKITMKKIEKDKTTKKCFYVRKFPIILKSCSLDSCLENINCIQPYESDSYYLNLIPRNSVPCRGSSSLSPKNGQRNDSGSSLISSSLDRPVDSGYPFSFSPLDADLTPEQVDELFTEMSKSSTGSSEADEDDAALRRNFRDIFVENVVVENGDVANNNRDGEGNNVEGLIGQRLVIEPEPDRDPNDNMFFPEVEEFPPWLLNLGDLALHPFFVPPQRFLHEEKVADDSCSD